MDDPLPMHLLHYITTSSNSLTATISALFVGSALMVCAHHSNTPVKTPAPPLFCKPPALSPMASPLQVSIDHIRAVHSLAPRFTSDILHAAKRAHVSPVLVAAIVHIETGHVLHPGHAVSSAGAIGPMQLMPATAWRTLKVNPWIPSSNILGGARYIAFLLHFFHGHLRLALAAYNTGPYAVLNEGVSGPGAYYAHQVMLYMHRSQHLFSYQEVTL